MLKKRDEYHGQIDELLTQAREYIAQGRLRDGYECMDKSLALDFDHPRVMSGLKYINFWQERIRSTISHNESMEQAEMFLQHWRDFTQFIADFPRDEQFIQSFRHLVFSRVYSLFEKVPDAAEDPDIKMWLGIACKGLGNYEEAQEHLGQALSIAQPRARLLSELADVFVLVGEEQKAKVLLREAFFVDPQDIDIFSFESEFFIRLCTQVLETGVNMEEAREWIPVYGSIWGILNVKRELRALEYGKLRQKIFAFEQEIRDENKVSLVKPRLLNYYFWLIDHLVMNREDQRKIDEILLKIRSISPEVYKLYTN